MCFYKLQKNTYNIPINLEKYRSEYIKKYKLIYIHFIIFDILFVLEVFDIDLI